MNARLIAVTGGIACGKSTLSGLLSELGCKILDTDEVTHALQGAHGEAVEAIADRFGAAIVSLDGAVRRKALGRIVFADAAARADLEAIMHPLVDRRVAEWIETHRVSGVNAILVPLLFEAGYDRKFPWDAIVAVVCSPKIQMQRLLRRGLSPEEAQARIAAQMPCDEKSRRADFTIVNDGTKTELKEEAEKLLDAISRLPSRRPVCGDAASASAGNREEKPEI